MGKKIIMYIQYKRHEGTKQKQVGTCRPCLSEQNTFTLIKVRARGTK